MLVHGEQREPRAVRLGDGAAGPVAELLADRELLVVAAVAHGAGVLEPARREPAPLAGLVPRADQQGGRVPVVALHRELARVAVAAVDAHGLERHHVGGLARREPRHRRARVVARVGVEALGRARGQEPRGGDRGRHVGQLELDGLVLADGLAEGGLRCWE